VRSDKNRTPLKVSDTSQNRTPLKRSDTSQNRTPLKVSETSQNRTPLKVSETSQNRNPLKRVTPTMSDRLPCNVASLHVSMISDEACMLSLNEL
jgi:hypothetical protein